MRLLVIFLLTFSVLANLSTRRQQLVRVIDEQISELSRLSRVSGNSDPVILLRIAEAYLEKGRILRDQENEDFFKLSIKQRQRINKNKFYAKSKAYFKKAQETGYAIIKKYKNFKDIGEVYYILAFNEKENGNLKNAKKLLNRSIKLSRKNSSAYNNSNIAIADIFYGDGDYRKSRKHYNRVISNFKNDKWYTRYLYNLAWSNYRVGKRITAERQMKEVWRLSENSKYVNKRDLAQRDLGYFYTDQGKLKKAKSFYTKIGGDTAKNFFEMGIFLKGKQKYTKALNMFNSAYLMSDQNYKVKSLIEILAIHDKYNNNGAFYKRAKESLSIKMGEDDRKEVLFLISKRAAVLQKKLGESSNRNRPKVLRAMAKYAGELYLIASKHDPSLREKSYFYAAESYYAGKLYEKALEQYRAVIELNNTNSKFYMRSVESMLTVVDSRSLPKSIRLKYFAPVYATFIKTTNDIKKKGRAGEKLFSFYIDEVNDIENGKKVMFQYAKFFPRSIGKIEAMIGRVVDNYKKANNAQGVVNFSKELKQSSINLTQQFVKKLNNIILTTQMSGVETYRNKGDKLAALRGYVRLYSSKETSKEAKSNSAYNIAVLFYELGNSEFMYLWLNRAISEMSVSEVSKQSSSIKLIITDIFLRQNFERGIKITEVYLNKVCSVSNSIKESVLENYVVMGSSHYENIQPIENFAMRQLSKCRYKKTVAKSINEKILDHYLDTKNINMAVEHYKRNHSDIYSRLESAGKLRNLYLIKGMPVPDFLSKDIMFLYSKARNKNKVPVSALDEVASTQIEQLKRDVDQFKSIPLKFPENVYNATLQQKFKLITDITNKSISIIKIGSGEGVVGTYKLLIDAYESLANQVNSFTPSGKDAAYIKSFKNGMRGVVNPILQKVTQFKGELKGEVNKNTILVNDYGEYVRKSIGFIPFNDWVIMDRRGK